MGQFGVGQAVRRVEDQRLLTGGGRYTDDIDLPKQTFAVVLRSPHAHAEIRAIDTGAARGAPGVLLVLTAEDLSREGIGDIPCLTPVPGKNGSKTVMPPHPVLARGRVRHVGDPVAFVVAETLDAARDAAELIEVDYADLPAVVDAERALTSEAPQIWDAAPGNLCLDWELGDRAATEAAFAKAARTVSLRIVNNRLVVASMEARGAIGDYRAEPELFTLYTGTQGGMRLRPQFAKHIFKLPEERFRVVTPDVGGGFGMKIFLYAEQVLVQVAARRLGRPVKWRAERSEAFVSDSQGRDHVATAELALDGAGRILALRAKNIVNLGAYLSNFAPYVATSAGAKMFGGLYDIPAVHLEVKCVFTNVVPIDAYRGAGRPEYSYMIERLADAAARELGLSPAEFRRRNLVRPEALPYKTGAGMTFDSGDYVTMMDRALKQADWQGAAARKTAARQAGKLRGIGFACYVEGCGSVGEEAARLRLDEDGGATLHVGTQTNGQGHATAYMQILSDRLGLDPLLIRTRQGDTAAFDGGWGTGGSRSLLMGGMAAENAAAKAIERARKIAGHILEAAEADIDFADGVFSIVGTDRRIALSEVAQRAAGGEALPEDLAGPIEESGEYTAPPTFTYPNGCHVCEVEVDEATGTVEVLRYVVVDDFGRIVNPLLVAGQVHGGIAQGLGQALLERTVYDAESGQLLSGSFMDYCLPRAADMPDIELTLVEDYPCTTNPMGVKGAGEAGAVGAPSALINALLDALGQAGVTDLDMPATPERVWRALRDAAAS